MRQARLRQLATGCTDRRDRILAAVIVAAGHLLLLVWLMHGSSPRRITEAETRLIMVLDTASAPASAPRPAPPMPQAPPRPHSASKPAPTAPRQPDITRTHIAPPVSSLPEPAPLPEPVREAVPEPPTRTEPEPNLAPALPENPAPARPNNQSRSSAAPANEHIGDHYGDATDAAKAPGTGVEQRWQAELLRHLDRHLRYPQQARHRRQHGVALVRFRIDSNGRLQAVALERGSGHESLDKEALAVLKRAQPLPAPPPELGRNDIDVVLPITFRLRRR